MTSPQVRHIQIRCGGSMLESDLYGDTPGVRADGFSSLA